MSKYLSDTFISQCVSNKSQVSIYLVNGIGLKGQITEQGEDSFILTREGISQLVMFHALATVLPLS